jgi:hypothetical protein
VLRLVFIIVHLHQLHGGLAFELVSAMSESLP